LDDVAIASAAREARIVVEALSRYQIRVHRPGLVLGYGRLHESAIDAVVGVLAGIVDRHL
jgi:hypothetical protein